MNISFILALLNALAFFYYGFNCLLSGKMVDEFYRYGLNDTQRRVTGVSQVVGAIGVATGLFFPLFGLLGSVGLSLLMLLGFGVRLKIKDGFVQSLPAFTFMILNAYLSYYFYLLIA